MTKRINRPSKRGVGFPPKGRKKGKAGNQFTFDPRQNLYWEYFVDPNSETFSNSYRSALRAGYDENYASQLSATQPDWLKEKISDAYLISAADRNLKEFVDLEVMNTVITKDGDEILVRDPALMRIKADITKFIRERLNKKKYAAPKQIEVDKKDDGSVTLRIDI